MHLIEKLHSAMELRCQVSSMVAMPKQSRCTCTQCCESVSLFSHVCGLSHQSLQLQEKARLDAELARQLAEEEDCRQQQVSCRQLQCILTVNGGLYMHSVAISLTTHPFGVCSLCITHVGSSTCLFQQSVVYVLVHTTSLICKNQRWHQPPPFCVKGFEI